MKALLILLTVIFLSFSQAMSQQPVLDHIALYGTDLKKSSAFYRDVLGLDSLPEPLHDGKHAWFAIGQGKQLHIIEGATSRTDQPLYIGFSSPAYDLEIFIRDGSPRF